MLSLEEKSIILNLLRNGHGVTEIVQRTGRSISTVYNLKRQKTGVDVADIQKSSNNLKKVDDFVEKRLRLGASNVHKLHQDAKLLGYKASYVALQTQVRNSQHAAKSTYRRSQHVVTQPGEQAQVDWGSFGTMTIGGRTEPLYAFLYILSYSRALYVEFVVRQNQQTLHACHEHAFAKLGVARAIRYDNMKTVVVRRERRSNGNVKVHITPALQDFARYYGFVVDPCPPYWPRAKGKVEASVKYLRRNFMDQQVFGKTFKNLDEINNQVADWLKNIAMQRLHRSTERRPYELWLEEKSFLQFPDIPPYNSTPFLNRYSTKDGLVQYKKNLYAVPMLYARKKLTIHETTTQGVAHLEIYHKLTMITRHVISYDRGKWVLDGENFVSSGDDAQSRLIAAVGRIRRPSVKVVRRGLSYYNELIPKS